MEGRQGFLEGPSEDYSALEALGNAKLCDGLEDYSQADVFEVYNYIRGGRSLKIPPEWRAVLPKGFIQRSRD